MCGFKSSDKAALAAHQKVHEGTAMPFVCPVAGCDYRASRKANYVRHVRVHELGEKPHRCETCGFQAMQKADLIAHVRVHTGERPFACDICE